MRAGTAMLQVCVLGGCALGPVRSDSFLIIVSFLFFLHLQSPTSSGYHVDYVHHCQDKSSRKGENGSPKSSREGREGHAHGAKHLTVLFGCCVCTYFHATSCL